MSKYIMKRILLMLPILLGVSFIVFAIMSFTPPFWAHLPQRSRLKS